MGGGVTFDGEKKLVAGCPPPSAEGSGSTVVWWRVAYSSTGYSEYLPVRGSCRDGSNVAPNHGSGLGDPETCAFYLFFSFPSFLFSFSPPWATGLTKQMGCICSGHQKVHHENKKALTQALAIQ